MSSLFLTVLLISIGIISRLAPHPANATALGAISLMAGRYLPTRYAWGVPIAAMLASDFLISGYELGVMMSVYVSFTLIALIGAEIKRHQNFAMWFIGIVGASTIFFLITNAAVWALGHGYPPTLHGLLQSYINALPFWRNMLAGDLVSVTIILGCARVGSAYGQQFIRRLPALLRGI